MMNKLLKKKHIVFFRWTNQCSHCDHMRSMTPLNSSWTTIAMCCDSTATGMTQMRCLVIRERWFYTISWLMTLLKSERLFQLTLVIRTKLKFLLKSEVMIDE